MARREVFAEVITPLDLPDGCALQPGQAIDTREIESIGEETMGRFLRQGSVVFRTRVVSDAPGGIVESAALADSIERERGEAAALSRALRAVRKRSPQGDVGAGGSDEPSRSDTDETLRGLALSLLALAWAHRELRQEFEALKAKLPAAGKSS